MDKILNIQSNIDKNGENIGFLSSQIDMNLQSFNLSIHINNKELCENNKEEIKEKCNEIVIQTKDNEIKTTIRLI